MARYRWDWLPLPVSACLIVALWIANPPGVFESRTLSLALSFLFTCLGSFLITVLMARSFMATGQPASMLFGCGALVWGCTSLIAVVVGSTPNTLITIHNLGVFATALCHGAGLLWRGSLLRRSRWLTASHVLALLVVGLIVGLTLAGHTPEFFHQGRGGTWIRQCVLTATIAVLAWVAGRLLRSSRGDQGAFTRWYGLGLALLGIGLVGVTLQSSFSSMLGWSGRLTQYLAGTYLLVTALIAAANARTSRIPIGQFDQTLHKYLANVPTTRPQAWIHYGLAVLIVAATSALRLALETHYDVHLPPYVLYYPALVLVALISGLAPAVAALVLANVALFGWGLATPHPFEIHSPADRFALVVFNATCLFMSGIVTLYQTLQQKAVAYERQARTLESRERLATFAQATFEGIVETEDGRIIDCNEQFMRMSGYHLAQLRRMEFADLVAPEDRHRLIHPPAGGQDSVEFALIHHSQARVTVEAHARWVSPAGRRLHIAMRDITAHKQIQRQILALNQQLEHRVKERTAALEAANLRLSAVNHQLEIAMRSREAEIHARHRLEREILEISEREQSRLGQDLHDGLGQELAGIAMLSDVHARKLRSEDHPLRESADQIAHYVRASINSARLLAKGHYPIELNRYGLLVALKDLATQTTQRCDIPCHFNHQGVECNLEKSAEIHLYRIIQECVANAVKHARPQHITIDAVMAPTHHVFTVTDDGDGFKPPAENHGMGLHLIAYRARMIGAHIRRESVVPHGCRVICSFNVPACHQPHPPGGQGRDSGEPPNSSFHG